MPRIIETTVYRIDELPEAAKARARDWYVNNVLSASPYWYEPAFLDFRTICEILGITLATMKGAPNRVAERTAIWFTGFCHQGDGASFEGTWSYEPGGREKIRNHAPGDQKLHRIADRLQAAQRRSFYALEATITHEGNYSHEHSMVIDIERTGLTSQEPTAEAIKEVKEGLQDLARWLYGRLQEVYDAEASTEEVDSTLLEQDYPFTADGKVFPT